MTNRSVPGRVVLLSALAVLVVVAALRPGPWVAVLTLPIALVVPGVVLQRRFLPGIDTETTSAWLLRVAVSVAWWLLVGLGVGVASVPVASVWPVLVGSVLLAAIVVGDPDGGTRWGRAAGRDAVVAVLAVVVAVAVCLTGRGLAAAAGDGSVGPGPAVLVAFASQTAPLTLAPTGASGAVTVDVRGVAGDARRWTVSVRVGHGLPWSSRTVDLDAGDTARVTVSGPIQVCRDAQQVQVAVTADDDAPLPDPLTAVVQGAAGAPACV